MLRIESNISLRIQVFVGLTRSRAWATMTGVGSYPFFEEVKEVLESESTFTFTFKRPPKQDVREEDEGEIVII